MAHQGEMTVADPNVIHAPAFNYSQWHYCLLSNVMTYDIIKAVHVSDLGLWVYGRVDNHLEVCMKYIVLGSKSHRQ